MIRIIFFLFWGGGESPPQTIGVNFRGHGGMCPSIILLRGQCSPPIIG